MNSAAGQRGSAFQSDAVVDNLAVDKLAVDHSTERLAHEIAYDMAYGLSHELNNPLANIAARARLLAEQENDERKRALLSAIVDQAMRGCEMIADLMLVARPPQQAPVAVDLNELAQSICKRARPWCEARSLTIDYDQWPANAAAKIVADRSCTEEAIWAVLRNAIEVAQAHIEVRLQVDESELETTICLSIEDDGPGISNSAMVHAFHPYFSGREAGRGLGLGLSKAQRFLSLSGGWITLENLAPGGCCAKLFWPKTDSDPSAGS
ncbi:MAG: HAMP domain-containing histidine kinase [Pirellulaceae bacterium]|nr:HAMP domain-containing histidine kinase [Pirellulaceae bacterium]